MIRDRPMHLVSEMATQLRINVQRVAGVQEIDDRLTSLRRQFYPEPVEISGEEAHAYLSRVVSVIESALAQNGASYSWHRWIWFLRRVADSVFQFQVMNTPDYDRAVAETAAGKFGTLPDKIPDEYIVEPTTVRRVLRFCGMCLHLSDSHGALQWAGAGARFRFSARPIPDPVPSALDDAVRLYVSRLDAELPMFARLGVATSIDPPRKGAPVIAPLFRERTPTIVKLRDLRFPFDESLEANYQPIFISIEDVVQFLSDPALADAQFPDSIAALFLLHRVLLALAFAHIAYPAQMLLFGFCHIPWNDFITVAGRVCTDWRAMLGQLPSSIRIPTAGRELLTQLLTIKPVLQPFKPGPIVAVVGDKIAVDLAAASQRMYADLEIPTAAGDAANYRSNYFELAVQALIDRTSRAPSSPYRVLRGRKLRLNGNAVTDVDAIAELPDRLLLVSCKSIPFSGRYDMGEYSVVRNATSLVVGEVEKHAATVNKLNANLAGDNYTFGKPLIPVVCTPHALLVPIGSATAEVVSGLRAAVSVSELASWCQESGA